MASASEPLLEIEGLRVSYDMRSGPVAAVDGIDLTVHAGETVGLVGESGSGKSTVGAAVLRYLGANGRISGGRIRFRGEDMAALSEAALRRVRGSAIALIHQEPMAALNPVLKIGEQLMEGPMAQDGVGRSDARARALEMLGAVHLADPERAMEAYPHQLSGGQLQRAVIAMALLSKPALLILDEPTTALDATVEAGIAELLRELSETFGMAQLFISHNLGLILETCARVAVMRQGKIVEAAPARKIFSAPEHAYTQALMAAVKGDAEETGAGEQRPASDGAEDAPVLAISGLHKRYPQPGNAGVVAANREIDLEVRRGETVALVGESGSGKSTLAKIVMGLEHASEGTVVFQGKDIATLHAAERPAETTGALQMVFQNPHDTLNPSLSIGRQLTRAVRRLAGDGPHDEDGQKDDSPKAQARALLERVRLAPELFDRRPGALSGGQKQRVAIARALAGKPALVIADEPVSALDVSIQGEIVSLLQDIQRADGTAILLISHDLPLVSRIARRVVVLYLGQVMEAGPRDAVFARPHHPYTEALLSAVPKMDPDGAPRQTSLSGETQAAAPASGCPFAGRCPKKIGPVCDDQSPPRRQAPGGHVIACHIPLEEL